MVGLVELSNVGVVEQVLLALPPGKKCAVIRLHLVDSLV